MDQRLMFDLRLVENGLTIIVQFIRIMWELEQLTQII